MISTVTTTTTTVTTVASTTMTAGLGLMATLVLIAALIAKELAGASAQARDAVSAGTVALSRAVDRVLNVAVVPLLLVFGFIVVVRILQVLH